MRSIATEAEIADYLQACEEDLRDSIEGLRRALDASQNDRLWAELHRLKNVFLGASDDAGVAACKRLLQRRDGLLTAKADVEHASGLAEQLVNRIQSMPELRNRIANASQGRA